MTRSGKRPGHGKELSKLLERAAQARPGPARAAAAHLNQLRLEDPEALEAILAALAQASPAAREAAGQWLFFPESDHEARLRLGLAARARELLELASAHPESGWTEGLAEVVGLRAGRALSRLTSLARQHVWAQQAVAQLPPNTRLAGKWEPGPWLARLRLGPAGMARVKALVAAKDWPAMARLRRDELVLAQALTGPNARACSGQALAWPAGPGALARLKEVCRLTADEGLEAARLAQLAAGRLKRVVVLMGNASLGGPPLWAAIDPWQQEAGLAQRARPKPPASQVNALARLRARRLGGPGLLRALWDLRIASLVAGQGERLLTQLVEQSRAWLRQPDLEALMAGELGLALGGPSLVPALARARQALADISQLELQGRAALRLIYGLAGAGKGLVLPWVDKFVASTLRAGDFQYLAGVARLLAGLRPAPLLLMIDESAHPAPASLAAVLQAAQKAAPGLAFRGLGALGGGPEPASPARALLAAAKEAHLVALRPRPGPHPPLGLDQALRQPRQQGRLSPASRDGADYLLSGTCLEPLSSGGSDQLGFSPAPWLLTDRGFASLGAYYRHRVRTLAGRGEPPARFWRRYQTQCGLA